MKRRGRNPNENPGVKPVEKIELSEKNTNKRLIISIVLLVLALALIAYALISALTQDDGWTEISVTQSSAESSSNDLIFQYDLGDAGISATAEHKAVAALYTTACGEAYRLFSADKEFTNIHNLYYLNHHIGEEITVDSALYSAFELLDSYENRLLYAAPMYTEYKNLFLSQDDASAAEFDPYKNADVAAYFADAAKYAIDENHVRLKLLGGNRVCLFVSEPYREFAAANGITSFIDFYWMKNAFVVDYVAQVMIDGGYTHGNISSFDGFTRNLDTRGISYSYNIFGRIDGEVYSAARLQYTGATSIVFLRAYSISKYDETYYTFADGTVRHAYIDVADGLCKNSLENLLSYSREKGCAEVLLSVINAFVSDSFKPEVISDAAGRGVYSVYFDGYNICYNDANAVFSGIYKDDKIEFKLKAAD